MGRDLNRGLGIALLVSGVVTLALHLIPYGDRIALPLVWISTLAHELGHGLTAVLVGGSFGRLELFWDASGVSYTSAQGALAEAAVAAGGLLGPALAGALAFLASRTPRGARTALFITASFLLAVTALWIRNFFGVAFVVLLAFSLVTVAVRLPPSVARFVTAFLGVQLSLSVFARADYLFVATAQTAVGSMPSDVARIAQVLWLPYWVWGLVCGALSLVVLAAGLWLSLRGTALERQGDTVSLGGATR